MPADSFCLVDNSVIEIEREGKAGGVVKKHSMKGEIERSWEEREGRVERWRRVQGEQRGDEGREVGVGGGGGCAWVEDLPVNCAVASRVIGARLSERAWNSTPRGSARVHTLSVQDPCPSVSARQPYTSIYTATQQNSRLSLHTHAQRRDQK